MKIYTIKVTYKHRIKIGAESEESALAEANFRMLYNLDVANNLEYEIESVESTSEDE